MKTLTVSGDVLQAWNCLLYPKCTRRRASLMFLFLGNAAVIAITWAGLGFALLFMRGFIVGEIIVNNSLCEVSRG